MKKLLIAGLLVGLGGCSKAILVTPQAENVKLVTAAQKKRCDFVRTISTTQLIGPTKKEDALKMALNEAGEAGGIKGTTVVGEALRCKR